MKFEYLRIEPEALSNLEAFRLPKEIGYGTTRLPVLVISDYQEGNWGPLRMTPYQNFEMDPVSKVFLYAQEIFEGLKAYRSEEGGVGIFRPDFIQMRMNASARRMVMPELPEAYFMEAVHAIAWHAASFIPTGPGESLYIRPFMIPTDAGLSLAPSKSFRFVVVGCPSTSYYLVDSLEALIERTYCRAAPGGIGAAKTGGNYSASLQADLKAADLGYQQTVWLDAVERRYVEEMSGMNFCAVCEGTVVTPALTDTILAGSTRDSILRLASALNIPVRETRIDIEVLKRDIVAGRCTEVFGCGTASIVMPINGLAEEDGSKVTLPQAPGPITAELKQRLVGIQQRSQPDEYGWMVEVRPAGFEKQKEGTFA